MKTNKGQKIQKNKVEQVLENKSDKMQVNENMSAEKDGFRYDYDDSSDV